MIERLPAPPKKPLNKDAIIEDLKRKLTATENLLEHYKYCATQENEKAFNYYCELMNRRFKDMLGRLKELLENKPAGNANGIDFYALTKEEIQELIDIIELAIEVGNVESN